ncbi:MAG TPA: cell wall-binding repeat-containing protein, partial [Acidimicrobiales bacterium]|nr:cell wall-binding repeat-containing protein [Acidimicrobiales bacterium]
MLRRLGTVGSVALLVGVLAWASPPAGASHEQRISGADRFATAAQVSASRFQPGVPVAYVVTGLKFPDALAAGVAAGVEGGPVLLTERDRVPGPTADELRRLGPDRIVVVGGAGSVSDGVRQQLEQHTDGGVERIEGGDRYVTAAEVSKATFDASPLVYVASGESFPDALAGVPAAVRDDAPLLLVTKGGVPAATEAEIRRLGATRAIVLGGPGTVSTAVEDHLRSIAGATGRLQGADRFATSAAVSKHAFPGSAPVAYLATGRGYADALAAGPVAALAGGPVLLVRSGCVPYEVLDELTRLGGPEVRILGGDRAVGAAVEDQTRCPSQYNVAGSPAVTSQPASPAWNDDGPDPSLLRVGHRYYAYTTGTTWGNRIGVLVSDRPDGGWRTTTGQTYGSTALPSAPGWQVPDTQWAPAVYRYAGKYVMFYAAQRQGVGEWCLSVAVADAPEGPFHDRTGGTGPIVCQDHLGGTIDPHPFVDADGTPWLYFKNNDGIGDSDGTSADELAVSSVWAVKLSADGTWPISGHHHVMAKDSQRHPWQTTVDNPQMVLRGGVHYLFHTGGDYIGNDSYAVGYARCSGPLGPCYTEGKILQSYGDVAGPGGGTVLRDAAGG